MLAHTQTIFIDVGKLEPLENIGTCERKCCKSNSVSLAHNQIIFIDMGKLAPLENMGTCERNAAKVIRLRSPTL